MHDRLKQILETKKSEIRELKKTDGGPAPKRISNGRGVFMLRWERRPAAIVAARRRSHIRDFKMALKAHAGIDLIAEIKFGSPSAGIIRNAVDPVSIGIAYEKAGAAAISLLTDRDFFRGKIENLPPVKNAVSLPVLRKDFILDEVQVRESARFGADAILLIARILSTEKLKELIFAARELKMATLTEIHDEADLRKALDADADIIGINNRDLEDFSIDLATTFSLAPLIPKDRVVVCESGVTSAEDISTLKRLNIHAVLVGTALMGAESPGMRAEALVRAGRGVRFKG